MEAGVEVLLEPAEELEAELEAVLEAGVLLEVVLPPQATRLKARQVTITKASAFFIVLFSSRVRRGMPSGSKIHLVVTNRNIAK